MGQEEIQEKIKKIKEELQGCTLQELEQVQHTLDSLRTTCEGQLHYLGNFLGIEQQGEDLYKMRLGLYNANTYGMAQGGALYTLADVAIGYRILSQLSKEEKVVTLELKVNFVKPGMGTELRAIPEIIHWGRQTVVGQCRIEDDKGDLVSQALGTFFVGRR